MTWDDWWMENHDGGVSGSDLFRKCWRDAQRATQSAPRGEALGPVAIYQARAKGTFEWSDVLEGVYDLCRRARSPMFETRIVYAAPSVDAQAAVAPEGWKLVPIEPTVAMLNALQMWKVENYARMLLAAPASTSADARERFLDYWCAEVPDNLRAKWRESVNELLDTPNASDKLQAAWDSWKECAAAPIASALPTAPKENGK